MELEMAKAEAMVDLMIEAIRNNGKIDLLGCLYILRDQLERLDDEIEKSH